MGLQHTQRVCNTLRASAHVLAESSLSVHTDQLLQQWMPRDERLQICTSHRGSAFLRLGAVLMVCGGMGLLSLFGCFRRRDKRPKKRDEDTANPAYQVRTPLPMRTPLLRHCCATAAPLPMRTPLLRHCCATAEPLLRHCCATAEPLLRHCCATAHIKQLPAAEA